MRYPLFLELTGQPVVVVGAGRVATRKVPALLAAGGCVTVIGPRATAAIRSWARQHRLRWLRRVYRPGDLRGAWLVVAATDSAEVNVRVCADAQRRRRPVNCITPPAAGNFIVPAVVRRGGITLAISTGGASPALAKKLRQDLEGFLARGYVRRLKRMAAERQRPKQT
jgi:precorrin-2 dehydrogenase / sirohydrochlorin ferrochelatase